PTHVLALNKGKERSDVDDEVAHFELLGDKTRNDEYKQFGFEDNDTFERCKVTKVWFYWDKITRRVYLFHDKDWTWPIWVWDDPYKLDTFFNVFPLSFIIDPTTPNSRGEVSYYLD